MKTVFRFRLFTTLFFILLITTACDNDDTDVKEFANIADVTQMVFISNIDYYIPAATQSDLSTISIKLI